MKDTKMKLYMLEFRYRYYYDVEMTKSLAFSTDLDKLIKYMNNDAIKNLSNNKIGSYAYAIYSYESEDGFVFDNFNEEFEMYFVMNRNEKRLVRVKTDLEYYNICIDS